MAEGILNNLNLSVPDLGKLADFSAELKHIDKTAGKMLDQTPSLLLNAALALALIVGGWVLSRWLAGQMQNVLVRMRVEETLAAFLGSMARFIVFFACFVAGLSFVGLNSTSLAALLGATGLAIGLAMKGTLGHVASGMMLMVHRPFKVGDWVQTGDLSGTVKRIGLFSTEINTQDFVRVFIPNTQLWDGALQNSSYNRMRMIKFSIRLPLEADTAEGLRIMLRVVEGNQLILKNPAPTLGVDSFSPYGVECIVWVWVRGEDYGKVRYDLLLRLKEALEEEGFHLPYPQQTVHYMKPEGLAQKPEVKPLKKVVKKTASKGKRR
jgi:small conductance mechanosensitive channel